MTWEVVSDFAAANTAPTLSGVIEGNLSKLIVQSDSGFFYSLDSGLTWTPDKGSPEFASPEPGCKFYADKGTIITGRKYVNNSGLTGDGLWQWFEPQKGVRDSVRADWQKYLFEAYDLLGKEIRHEVAESISDLQLSPGFYIVRISHGQQIEVRKIIIGQ